MNKLLTAAGLAGLTLANGMALAAGSDSGTSTVGELNVTGAQFLMMLGAVVLLGVIVWVVIKVCSK